jgi:ABC-type Fe3+ transport system permease subunit
MQRTDAQLEAFLNVYAKYALDHAGTQRGYFMSFSNSVRIALAAAFALLVTAIIGACSSSVRKRLVPAVVDGG